MKVKILELHSYFQHYEDWYHSSEYIASKINDMTDWIDITEDEFNQIKAHLKHSLYDDRKVKQGYILVKQPDDKEQVKLLDKIRKEIIVQEQKNIQAELKRKEAAEKRAQKSATNKTKIAELKKQIKQLEREF